MLNMPNDHPDPLPIGLDPMKRFPYWVCYEEVPKTPFDPTRPWKTEKIPVNARTGGYAMCNTPGTWAPYLVVLETFRGGQMRGRLIRGLSYALWKGSPEDRLRLPPDRYIIGDLDGCRDPETGEIEPWAQKVVDIADTYTEITPSERGLRLIATGSLPGPGGTSPLNKRCEFYDRGKFLTITGKHLRGTPEKIEERTEQIAEIYKQYFPAKKKTYAKFTGKDNHTGSADLVRAMDALRYILAEDYDPWLRVGMALHSLDSREGGFTVWEGWSRTCPEKFKEGECRKKWASFHAERENGVTIATLFDLAIAGGWMNGHGKENPPDPDFSDADEQGTRTEAHAKRVDYPPGVTPEDVENWQTVDEERELHSDTAGEEPFNIPCPDSIWIGPFAAAGEALQVKSWPVWTACYALFSAYVGRMLTLKHYGTSYYGMSYAAVIGPTGRGKRLVIEVVKAGAPSSFHAGLIAQLAFGPPNSAPALGYMISHYVRDKKTGKVQEGSIVPTPCLCAVSEMGTLIAAAASAQQYNPLAEKLNELFDGDGYSHRLTDNPKGGGGALVVPNAEFSLIGTTTKERFQETMTSYLLHLGWVSRFLWLPLRREKFLWEEAEHTIVDFEALQAISGTIYPAKTSWLPTGAVFSSLLTPEAREYFGSLREYFADIFDEGHPAFSRHHIHFEKIAALLAWYRIAEASKNGRPVTPTITREELQAAETVVKVAEPFTRFLLDSGVALDPSTPAVKRFEYAQIEKVREALQKIPQPITSKGLFQRVRRRVPKIAELTSILYGLKASGEVDVLPTERGALFWPSGRPYPSRGEN